MRNRLNDIIERINQFKKYVIMETLLFRPFERHSEKTLVTIGVVLSQLAPFLELFFHGRFDGVFDMHFVPNTSFYQVLLDNVTSFFA